MKTPRTDASEWDYYEDCTPEDNMVVLADFARQLERELIAVTALADRLAEALEWLMQAQKGGMQPANALIGAMRASTKAIIAYQATKPA